MTKESKIKHSSSMIIGKIIPVIIVIFSAIMLLILLIPDGNKTVNYTDKEDVINSTAYYCSVNAVETILGDDHIEEIISISYICSNLNDRIFDYSSVKIVYSNGDEEKTRYFEGYYNATSTSRQKEFIFNEIDQTQHQNNSRPLIFTYIIPSMKNNDAREREYNDFAVSIIYNHAKEVSKWH